MQAERFAPGSANVASGLNIAAFNLGVAGGSAAGGQIVAHLGLINTPWIGAGIVAVALVFTFLSGWLDRRDPLARQPQSLSGTAAAGSQ
jgi:DHA1 family inner membrane transport protein